LEFAEPEERPRLWPVFCVPGRAYGKPRRDWGITNDEGREDMLRVDDPPTPALATAQPTEAGSGVERSSGELSLPYSARRGPFKQPLTSVATIRASCPSVMQCTAQLMPPSRWISPTGRQHWSITRGRPATSRLSVNVVRSDCEPNARPGSSLRLQRKPKGLAVSSLAVARNDRQREQLHPPSELGITKDQSSQLAETGKGI
jgi:hypothetical protein